MKGRDFRVGLFAGEPALGVPATEKRHGPDDLALARPVVEEQEHVLLSLRKAEELAISYL